MGTRSIPRLIKGRLKQILNGAGYELFNRRNGYAHDGLLTVHSDHFRNDPQFRAAYARGIKASAGVDPHFEWRVHVALWAARTAAKLTGDFVECGVNAGFISSAIMQRLNWSGMGRQFYLIDTFEGPVFDQFSDDEIERGRLNIARQAMAAGAFVTDMDRVHSNFSEWRNVQVIREGSLPGPAGAERNRDLLFVGTEFGLYVSMNGGQHWEQISPVVGQLTFGVKDQRVAEGRTSSPDDPILTEIASPNPIDTMVASARAYVNALNKMAVKRGRSPLTSAIAG